MLFDFEDYERFNHWMSTHPVLGTLAIVGSITVLTFLIYISIKHEEWEFKKRCNKR